MSKRKAIEADDESKGKRRRLSSPANLLTDPHSKPCSENFVYDSLSHEHDFIRVFKIFPDSADTKIRCTMHEVRLSAANYTCLSYMWQPSHPQHIIEVNGRSISVGENLYQFLHAYRATQTPKALQSHDEQDYTLWVDALCINQNNTREKGHQIRQMGEIYKRAAKVLIWLGVLANATKEFLAAIHALAVAPLRPGEDAAVPAQPSQGDLNYKLAENRMQSGFDATRISELPDHVQHLCDMTYWTRIWIAEEVLLPSDRCVFVFDGGACHEMSLFHDYFLTIMFKAERWKKPLGMSYFHWRCQRSVENRATQEKPSLSSLLTLLAGCGCQDARDRIFALLPLARSKSDFDLDYESDADYLFRAVFEQSIGNEPMEEIMSFGALLIEALEIRRPYFRSNRISSGNSSQTSDFDTQKVSIRPDPSMLVAPLAWGTSTLCIPKERRDLHTSCNPQTLSCMFVGLFDGGNTHVFEYAVEENVSGVVVKYARAYEYLQGCSQLPPPTVEYDREVRYTWLDKPSEDVYYLCGGFQEKNRLNNALHTWTSPSIEILDEPSRSTSQSPSASHHAHFRIKPAMRRNTIHEPWTGSSQSDSPLVFPAVVEQLTELQARYGQHEEVPIMQATSRYSSCRWIRQPNGPWGLHLDLSNQRPIR